MRRCTRACSRASCQRPSSTRRSTSGLDGPGVGHAGLHVGGVGVDLAPGGGEDAGQTAPGQVAEMVAQRLAAHRRALVEPVVGRRPDESDDAVPPRPGRRAVDTRVLEPLADELRDVGADECVEVAHRVGAARPVGERAPDDEPVDVGVGLDDAQVGVDRDRQLAPRLVLVGQRRRELADEPLGDQGADREVELAPVVEVAVDGRLAGAGLRGDLVHPHAGTVRPDRPHRRVDKLLAAGASVRLPAGTSSVGCLDCHGPDGT